ncbi:MAG: hypothetical protein WCD76_14735 [Pyrinomonadaceae bacterium]
MNPNIKFITILLSALLLAACASAGTGGSGGVGGVVSSPGSGSGSGASSSGGTTAVISADDKPLDVMLKAMRAQLDAKSYRAHVTSSTDKGNTSTMVIEYAAPDRYRMVNEGQTGGGKGYQMEYVIADNKTFIKTPNGGWVKSPVDAGSIIKAFRDPKMIDELTKTADVKFVGPDTLDGEPMLVYQYTQTNPMGMNLKSISKTWLSVADGLPRKTETEGEFNGMKTKTLITLSDFNTDIKIESPVK